MIRSTLFLFLATIVCFSSSCELYHIKKAHAEEVEIPVGRWKNRGVISGIVLDLTVGEYIFLYKKDYSHTYFYIRTEHGLLTAQWDGWNPRIVDMQFIKVEDLSRERLLENCDCGSDSYFVHVSGAEVEEVVERFESTALEKNGEIIWEYFIRPLQKEGHMNVF
jgi:hypothetical protein